MMTKDQATYAKFEALEEQLAHCYFMLHERFIADPPLAKFWAETAMDELQHHSILKFCREHEVMTVADIGFDTIEHVEQLLETVKGIVSDPDVSVEEGFYAALLMESSEMDDVYKQLTRGLAKDHRLLYAAIQNSLRSHHAGFTEAAEEFCRDRGIAEAFRNLDRRIE
jgi:hypothetical protein